MVPMQVEAKKPFLYNVSAVWKQIPRCSICCTTFSTIRQDKVSRKPMILDCLHNVCEACVFSNLELLCKKCKVVTKVFRRRPIRENLEYNYHLLGFLSYYEHTLKTDIQGVCQKNFVNNVQPMQNLQKWCSIHKNKLNNYCKTCNSIFCYQCIKKDHENHLSTPIWEENKKHEPKIMSLIETTKIAKQRCKRTQKEIKHIEQTYENYALEAVNQVSNHFLTLHAHLQKAEKKLLMNIKKNVSGALNSTNILHSAMTESSKTFQELIKFLNNCLSNEKSVFFPEIINRAQSGLQNFPCSVVFQNNFENPFELIFSEINDFEDYIDLNCEEVKLESQMHSYYETMNLPSPQENANLIQENMGSKSSMNSKLSIMGSKSSICTLGQDQEPEESISQKVHISHIKNPEHFFVQTEKFLSTFADFKCSCSEEAGYAKTPDAIEINEIYLIYNTFDKTWHRAKVLALKEDKFHVSLIDYGNEIEVPKKRFRDISKDLRLEPFGAIECSIYGIKSKDLTDAAKSLMVEIVNNEFVDMLTLFTSDSINYVDIIATQGKHATSLRDALIYTNLVEEQHIGDEFKRNLAALEKRKEVLFSGEKQCFYRNSFKFGEYFNVTVLHVNHPQEFYVIKNDHKADFNKMQAELNEDYQDPQPKLFAPQPGTPCAIFINDNWYRARYLKSLGKGLNKIWLVDYGFAEIVNWKQIRVLNEKFLNNSEFAFQCSLSDIEPLQENDYSWTDEAIEDFKRMTKNPFIQIFIHRSKDFRYKVVLLIIKANIDININAKLVILKHAIATGSEAVCVNIPKKEEKKGKQIKSIDKTEIQQIANNQITRTEVKITHVVSPGEFYIQEIKHLYGIGAFQQQIQPTEYPINETEINEWKKDDKCLVHTSIDPHGFNQWYRGIITDVDISEDETSFTVFLPDFGNLISNICSKQLTKISSSHNQICHAAVRCHLACVQPTGGLATWSYSSIDEFKSITKKYDSFEATIQGQRDENSIPIVLWGKTAECTGPLSPNISKWINVNKSMVNCGLAHLTEKIDTNLQTDVISYDLMEGEVSIEKWIENCNAALENCENKEVEETSVMDLKTITTNIDKTLNAWIPARPIEKQVFKAHITYLDNQGIVYLHDFDNHLFLENMKSTIKLRANDLKIDENYQWRIGQPCLAHFHSDGHFYRAEVKKIKAEKILSVTFIDYGNVEDVSFSNVSYEIMLREIQTMSNKFEIDQIVPVDGKGVWPTETLDFIHAQIVGKTCIVQVSPNQENRSIPKCSIRFESFDIAQVLINENMAIRLMKRNFNRNESFNVNVSGNNNLSKESDDNDEDDDDDDDDDDFFIEPNKSPEPGVYNDNEYKSMFDKKELENLFKSTNILSDDASSGDDIVELTQKYKTDYWNQCNNENPEHELFDSSSSSTTSPQSIVPDATLSTMTSHIKGLNKFNSLIIPQGVLKFYADVSLISNSYSLYLAPFLTEIHQQFNYMSSQLQIVAKNTKPLSSFEPGNICLAVYTVDKLWYRAIIRSYSPEVSKVDVLFVDFLNAETISVDYVRKCPKHLLKYPLRNIFVTLDGIKPNIRFREVDIQKRLSVLLSEYDRVFVKIIKTGPIPTVQLFSSQEDHTVIYNELIQEKFYLKSCK